MAAKKFGFAVLGMGNMGGVHVQSLLLSARAKLQWLVRSQVKDAERFVQSHGLPARCATPDDLDLVLDDSSVDAVVICSPTDVHEDQIRRSLQAGKAVFCEKPITADTESTAACYDLSERLRHPLFCAFHRRFDPSFREVKAGVENRTLGGVKMIRCSSHDQDYPPASYLRSSGGLIKDSTIHDLDMSLWLAGSRPKRVMGQGQAFHPVVAEVGDFDLLVATVLFENGVVAVIDNGRKSSQAYDQRLEVICEKGGYQVGNQPTNLMSVLRADATSAAPGESGFVTRYVDAYRAEIEHFLDVLEGRAQLGVSRQDTLAAMSLADALTTATKTQRPVDL
ncbi:inositol 2-dehydrogenase-like [Babylonia areolata]|uniref:inositol 2-dehydrogenase-like n=1 Tax=Babylonia areolata TaxID=304850 RepID=UPI003FD15A86